MPANYLHGVETLTISKGSKPVKVVKSAVIALTGIAPKGPSNELVQCLNDQDDAQFGSPLTNFTIPQALAAIRKQGSATVLVVNVYDEATHSTTVTNEEQTVEEGKFALDFEPVNVPLVKIKQVSAVRATAAFTITGGTSTPGTNKITQVTAGATSLLAAAVDWATSNNATATAVASAINSGTGTHGYTAAAVGAVVTVTAPVGSGAGANGRAFAVTVGGDVTVGTVSSTFSGGVTGQTLTTLEAGVDYQLTDYGKGTVIDFSVVPEGTVLQITYKKLNASAVLNSHLIGEVDAEAGTRTGTKLYDLAYAMYGYTPKIFIAPKYSTSNTIATELRALSVKFKGVDIVDAPQGTTVSAALTGRGPLGGINFQTSSQRSILAYPHLKAYDAASDSEINVPYSPYLAGIISATDNNEGFHVSPSNKEILGVVGTEFPVSFQINRADTEANSLNENGVVTIANSFGTGIRTWGNRNAAFPSATDPYTFISVRRTADVIHESVEFSMLQFIDRPINQALIDSIRGTVNAFIRTLIGRGALVDGECTWNADKNPAEQIAAGQLVFDITFMPPPPLERLTFESFLDINLLKKLK